MTPTEATQILSSIEDYYQKNITDNPIAATVWVELFLPLSPDDGARMAKFCIENHAWLPSPKALREEFLQSIGLDFKQELKQAIAAYSSADTRLIREIPREISQAIIAAGGANKFRNATEQQWEKLEKQYISIRTEAAQKVQLTALAGGKPKALEASK